jgi:ectoine hydroxylase-related dioxygenase (phytanoyl-CoA dioxygenase family)
LDEQSIEQHKREVERDGYTVVPDAIELDLVDEICAAITHVEKEKKIAPRGNVAEGFATLRTYNLLAHGKTFEKMPVHDNVLPIAEALLDRGCLLSGMTAIRIGPGESQQAIHADDGVMTVARPHVPLVVTSMWALTDFTAANGATRVVPGSHLYEGNPDYRDPPATIPVEMRRGSVMIMHGSLWHGGGANTTQGEWRLGVNLQYCAGFIRQQQNQYLSVARETARGFSERLQKLCGYGLYKGIMGHVDSQSPAAILSSGQPVETAYARASRERL